MSADLTTRGTPRKRRVARPGTSVAERIALHTDRSGHCWIWTGAVDKATGYGRIELDGKSGYAHRASYEAHVGSIPPGLHIDHLCRVRACCNPDHLEPVTPAVNTRRSPLTHGKETHCPHGHAYSGQNLTRHRGSRRCRTCNLWRCRIWNQMAPEDRAARRAAGLLVVDLAAFFAAFDVDLDVA